MSTYLPFSASPPQLARKTTGPSLSRDVSGEGVQQSLLKLLEGCEVNIPKVGLKQKPGGDTVTIDTQHILFICAGSFAGIEDIIRQRLREEKGHHVLCEGEDSGQEEGEDHGGSDLQQTQTDDLMKFGLIPEFIGEKGDKLLCVLLKYC